MTRLEEIRSRQGDGGNVTTTEWTLLEIAAQLAEANQIQHELHPELGLPLACKNRECSYYEHYLAYGGPELTHEGFHAAEKSGEAHMRNCPRSEAGKPCPTCQSYELRLRA